MDTSFADSGVKRAASPVDAAHNDVVKRQVLEVDQDRVETSASGNGDSASSTADGAVHLADTDQTSDPITMDGSADSVVADIAAAEQPAAPQSLGPDTVDIDAAAGQPEPVSPQLSGAVPDAADTDSAKHVDGQSSDAMQPSETPGLSTATAETSTGSTAVPAESGTAADAQPTQATTTDAADAASAAEPTQGLTEVMASMLWQQLNSRRSSLTPTAADSSAERSADTPTEQAPASGQEDKTEVASAKPRKPANHGSRIRTAPPPTPIRPEQDAFMQPLLGKASSDETSEMHALRICYPLLHSATARGDGATGRVELRKLIDDIGENHAAYVLSVLDRHQASQYKEYMEYLEQIGGMADRDLRADEQRSSEVQFRLMQNAMANEVMMALCPGERRLKACFDAKWEQATNTAPQVRPAATEGAGAPATTATLATPSSAPRPRVKSNPMRNPARLALEQQRENGATVTT